MMNLKYKQIEYFVYKINTTNIPQYVFFTCDTGVVNGNFKNNYYGLIFLLGRRNRVVNDSFGIKII